MNSTPQTNPLIGGPVSDDEQRAYSAWAKRIEAGRYEPAADGEVFEGAAAAENATELLESLIGADSLSEAIGRGRPGLEGRAGGGPSVTRQVRLSQDLDARLAARAAGEDVELSVNVCRALDDYLRPTA
ncbi:hypothetical protein [Rathayibacter festucae]|uniref:Ribbon-helix-helix protein CopG domain-containing protein n=1 Tax=Rathayibacter festucae DSM 15932 TaxID=1328866 RepID=A0A3Q9UUR7_9MICO|nr:hypothetical protein [Rathayibacter festucae]AZZ53533.1 hypothetical protein C1I64_16815 [Rathayibacter festucae DSM 15932]